MYASVEALATAAQFGSYGGRFIPETLMAAHEELERVYVACSQDAAFRAELEELGRSYIGRPTPLTHAKRLSAALGGAQIWLKREDLAHTGSHKINNAIGQVRQECLYLCRHIAEFMWQASELPLVCKAGCHCALRLVNAR